ncbi:MAG: hypothetical protein H6637_05330 [Ardenticatenales bacterium]|nr:hypothetical protein [Ardenticatenales bacterium]
MIALALDVSRFIDAVAALVLFALVCKVVRTRNNLPAEMLAYRLLALAALVKGLAFLYLVAFDRLGSAPRFALNISDAVLTAMMATVVAFILFDSHHEASDE